MLPLLRRWFAQAHPVPPSPAVEPQPLQPFERLHHRALDCFVDAQAARAQGRWADERAAYKQAMTLDLQAARQVRNPAVRATLTCSAATWAMKSGALSRATALATQALAGAGRDTRAQALELIGLIAVTTGDAQPRAERNASPSRGV